jgi:hypothetical protein
LLYEKTYPTQDKNAELMEEIYREEKQALDVWLEDEGEESDYPILTYGDRTLMEEQHSMENHMPLSCNENIASQDCLSFSSLLPSIFPGTPLVIPCGE